MPRYKLKSLLPYKVEYVSSINFNVGHGYFAGSGRKDDVVALFEGILSFDKVGNYTLCITSDGRSRLYLDNKLKVNHEGMPHSVLKPRCFDMANDYSSHHNIMIEFFKRGHSALIVFEWKTPRGSYFNPVPPSAWIKQSIPAFTEFSSKLVSEMEKSMTLNDTHKWGIKVNISSDMSGKISDNMYSFDCPFILPIKSSEKDSTTLLSVFHVGSGGESGHSALYVAESTTDKRLVPAGEDWHVLKKLSGRGSMGSLHMHPDAIQVFLSYEYESNDGNTIAIRLYENIDKLKSNDFVREIQLEREIYKLQLDKEFEAVWKKNIGTPTITDILEIPDNPSRISIQILFHYYCTTDQQEVGESAYSDFPGIGSIEFPMTGERFYYSYTDWYGSEDIIVEYNLRGLDVMGKIGQRALISDKEGNAYRLYEAQMAHDGNGAVGWLSWRPILWIDNHEPAILPFQPEKNLQTFANPRVTYLGEGIYCISFFIPSEPFNKENVEAYLEFDPQNCPTCGSSNIKKAEPPAAAGTLMMFVQLW